MLFKIYPKNIKEIDLSSCLFCRYWQRQTKKIVFGLLAGEREVAVWKPYGVMTIVAIDG